MMYQRPQEITRQSFPADVFVIDVGRKRDYLRSKVSEINLKDFTGPAFHESKIGII